MESGSGKLELWDPESWAMKSGLQPKQSRIILTVGIGNPSSTDKESEIWYLESGIHGVESRIQDLDYLTKETGSERKEELGLRRGGERGAGIEKRRKGVWKFVGWMRKQ